MFFARQYRKPQQPKMPKQPSSMLTQQSATICYSGIQFDRLCNILSLNRCHQPDENFLKH